jgi:hypothetical protein
MRLQKTSRLGPVVANGTLPVSPDTSDGHEQRVSVYQYIRSIEKGLFQMETEPVRRS